MPLTDTQYNEAIEFLQSGDVVELSTTVGRDVYSHLGALAFPELLLSYITACFKRRRFDDNTYLRSRLHSLLYWYRGFWKTSMIDYFLNVCTPSVEFVKRKKSNILEYTKAPKYISLTGRFSVEYITGGAVGDKLILPLLNSVDIAVCGEMMNFLTEERTTFVERMNYMNTVLEEGYGTVGLFKLAKANTLSDEEIENLQKKGINFDAENLLLNYNVNAIFMMASRPLSKNQLGTLNNSGYLDRLNVVRWYNYDNEFKEVWNWIPQPSQYSPLLKAVNTVLWETQLATLNSPPNELVHILKVKLDKIYQDISTKRHISLNVLYSNRDNVNLSVLLACSAYINLYKRNEFEGFRFECLRYSDKDVDFVLRYLTKYAEMKASTITSDDGNDSFQSELKKKHIDIIQTLGRGDHQLIDVVRYLVDKYKVHKRTAHLWVDEMYARRWVIKKGSESYKSIVEI